jgi:hypothetical protein
MKMTERSARWMETVLTNCEANTGRTLPQWVQLARKARVKDARGARAWGREQGLSIVYQTAVVETLFPAEDADDSLVDGQYSGPKAALRPIYDALVKAARALGKDVEVMPRKSQVTFSRATSFAVVRAATKDRVDVAMKLHGVAATGRLAACKGAMGSDPSHVVGVRAVKDVDRELAGWMRKAYERAEPAKGATKRKG